MWDGSQQDLLERAEAEAHDQREHAHGSTPEQGLDQL